MKQWYQDRMYARVIRMDGRVDRVQLDCMEDCGTLIASFPEQADWTDIRTVEFAPEMGQNKAGQDGYYIIPHGEGSVGDTILCRFREREDTEMVWTALPCRYGAAFKAGEVSWPSYLR